MTFRRVPRAMREPPRLPPERLPPPPTPGHALLKNPFHAKDPHASFGKHVLTPTLALTSIAGATPPEWTVAYWDENLLQGPPPLEPFPEVVGITVHLTFAARAFELAAAAPTGAPALKSSAPRRRASLYGRRTKCIMSPSMRVFFAGLRACAGPP